VLLALAFCLGAVCAAIVARAWPREEPSPAKKKVIGYDKTGKLIYEKPAPGTVFDRWA
jgi:hypothetical protein